MLGVVENMDLGALEGAAEVYVGLLAATILFIATNAGLLGVSRLSYSMGQHRQLPELLRALHPRFRTPYVAILLFGLIACVAILPGQADFLGVIYAFGAMLSFTIAHVSLITLRIKRPDAERPWRSPGTLRVAGYELPVLALFGGLGTGIALIVATVLDLRVFVSGIAWLAVGIAIYVVYRRRQGLSLTETHKIVTPKPVVEHEVEYESILVAFEDGRYSREAVATAVRLAARNRRRHPRGGDDHRAAERADRRRDAAAGGPRRLRDRLRQGEGRASRERALGEGAPRSGGTQDRGGGARDPSARPGDGAAPAAGRHVAVREDDRDRAERASLPRDHRVHARREEPLGSVLSRTTMALCNAPTGHPRARSAV